MALERTLSIIKPDAVAKGHVEEICKRLEDAGLSITEKKSIHLDDALAEGFYIEHKGKPFFEDLIKFMTSGPIQVQVLEGDNAIKAYRDLMGSTNPEEAKDGTIRKLYAVNTTYNSVHGSDSPENARIETDFFFKS